MGQRSRVPAREHDDAKLYGFRRLFVSSENEKPRLLRCYENGVNSRLGERRNGALESHYPSPCLPQNLIDQVPPGPGGPRR